MSRDIKFRAWDIKNKNMLIIFDGPAQSSWYIPEWKDNIIPMQYTGLKDKAGVEIYEGDIVEHVSTSFGKARGVVEFFARNRGPEFEITWFEGSPRGLKWSEYEVIGNRFESELMEGKE